MNKTDLVNKYFSLRRLNTDIYADTYRGGMDDFLHIPFSINDIKKEWIKYLKNNKGKKIDFYIHIPFCYTICKYCDFYKTLLNNSSKEEYLDYISWYIDEFKDIFKDIEFNSIYIGGGTPSILTPKEMDNVLSKIFNTFKFSPDGEKTFEINPVNITDEKVKVLRKYPINRISMGIQSTDPEVLEKSNRGYQKENIVKKTLELLINNGYKDINGDVIMGLKEDTLDSIKKTVYSMKEWGFSSVVLYRLLPTDEYLDEHFDGKLSLFNKEVIPRIESYYDYFSKTKDIGNFEGTIDNGYRWDIFFTKIKKEKYDDFSDNSLFGVGSSSRSHIFGNIYYKFLDEMYFQKDVNKNIFLGKYIDFNDEKDCYNIVNSNNKGLINLDKYEKIFGDKKIELSYLKDITIVKDNNIYFHYTFDDKIYKSLFLLNNNNLIEKIKILEISNNKIEVLFDKGLKLYFYIEKEDKSIIFYIGNTFSVNSNNIDLYGKIIKISNILVTQIVTLEKIELDVKIIFLKLLIKNLNKSIKNITY